MSGEINWNEVRRASGDPDAPWCDGALAMLQEYDRQRVAGMVDFAAPVYAVVALAVARAILDKATALLCERCRAMESAGETMEPDLAECRRAAEADGERRRKEAERAREAAERAEFERLRKKFGG